MSETLERPLRLARHMTIAVIAPVILLIVMGGGLAWQVRRLSDAADWVNHTNEAISKFYELRTRILEQESSLRAYLLTGDRDLLGPYEQFAPQAKVDELVAFTSDNSSQTRRLKEIGMAVKLWDDAAHAAIVAPGATARADLDGLRTRVRTLDRVRELIDGAVEEELALLHERTQDNADTERAAKIVFTSLLLLAALAIAFISRTQLGTVSAAFQRLIAGEHAAKMIAMRAAWIRDGEASVAGAVVGEKSVDEVSKVALAALVEHSRAVVGAVYAPRGDELARLASIGVSSDAPEALPAGSGLLGATLGDRKTRHVREASLQLAMAGGVAKAQTVELVVAAIAHDGATVAVVELGFDRAAPVPEALDDLLAAIGGKLALAVRSAEQRSRLRDLLDETQRQGEELQAQHEELRVTNEELEHQGSALREAHTRQSNVQHELEAANTNLEEQTAALEQQREELLRAQKDLTAHARELQLASQYKSEFLARMSHELRTPLNSSMILARLLADNPSGNLTGEQVRFADTIYSAGSDLLVLINDILDLAKIEAGRLELRPGTVLVARLRDTLMREFEPVAKSRALAFGVELVGQVPASMYSDEQRLVQVLRNLVSNACKFTDQGSVTVRIESSDGMISFAVRDTGIGIPAEHHQRVFEAFHQVDGSTSRKHGGTGLGLAISRDLAKLLGGGIELASEPGRGTTFTLTVPLQAPAASAGTGPHTGPGGVASGGAAMPMAPPQAVPSRDRERRDITQPIPVPPPAAVAGGVADDRDELDPSRRKLLIIEDDLVFAAILRDLGRELGFQALVASSADEGVALALRHVPDGILLDVNLPDHSGLTVLERIKRQPAIRHVPIHMCSVDDHEQRSLELGAIGYLTKPASRDELIAAIHRIESRTAKHVRRLLVVEDDAVQAQAIAQLLGGRGVEISTVGTIAGALDHLGSTTFDCMVMDLRLADGSGFELLEKMATSDAITFPPVIVHTGKDLTDEEESRLRHYSSSIIVKGARSPERLVDEVTLFLHQVEADLPVERQNILKQVRDREARFEGKRVLVVEDDVRNVFALSSVLEPRGLDVTIARNGREALDALARGRIDLVLMDVMMPEMNGLEATKRIRADASKKNMPIIMLTAKAMADDRQACLDAGANDYLAKPIQIDMLLSLLRVWMPR